MRLNEELLTIRLSLAGVLALLAVPAHAQVFPMPREMQARGRGFAVDERVVIVTPSDRALGRLIMSELSDHFGLAVRMTDQLPAGARAIVAGAISDPLVRRLSDEASLRVTPQDPGPEGYALLVTSNLVLAAGSDAAGAFYAVQSLRQLLQRTGNAVEVQGASIRDWPYKPFRGIKLYLPGREHIAFFKRFVRDFMAANKYNRMILELNAAMRFDRHPELNAGWLDLARDLDATRRDRPAGPHGNSNSSHQDTGDGGILEKEEVADLVHFAAENHIEVIPEIPSLSHSYYLLTRHPELAEVPMQWPDTYCPSLEASYTLLFDVLDEYIDVIHPRMVHIGKDEWRMPWGVCPRCRNLDYREVFLADLLKTYGHLRQRGVSAAMWADYLIEPLRGAGLRESTSPSGWRYRQPGALTPQQVRTRVPKDMLMFNWFWDDDYAKGGQGEADDAMLSDWGFQQVYGNMTPGIQNYGRRSGRRGVLGGAPSSWAATTEFNFGKDLMYSFLGCANLLWSTHWPDEAELGRIVQQRVEYYRPRLAGGVPPSDLDPVTPIPLPSGEAPVAPEMRRGRVTAGRLVFEITPPVEAPVNRRGVAAIPAVPIHADVSSIVFLHAAAHAAANYQAYRYIYNVDDSADLLGWYEVAYEDGFVETVPVRYRVNILEWDRERRADSWDYCYGASAIEAGSQAAKPVTFYAFEWHNPRYGKVVKEVRLKGAAGFRQGSRLAPENAIYLAAVSVVKARPAAAPALPERQSARRRALQ